MFSHVSPAHYELHLEVWLLVFLILALGVYVAKVLAPRAAAITLKQRWAFFGAVGTIFIASSWPIHDISESYLYFVHMIQHLAITFVAPPLILIATPEWLARAIVGNGNGSFSLPVWLKRLAHPVAAGVLFNVMVGVTHVPVVVNTSADNAIFHYFIHAAIFTTGLIMWLPVCGPFKELRLKPLGQMSYLFAMSLLPTIPAAFLTFASGPIYSSYTGGVRLWGISDLADHQAAGLIMKLLGGFYLWTIIAAIFFRWVWANEKASQKETGQKEFGKEPRKEKPLLESRL